MAEAKAKEAAQGQDQSMEEILSSIRRIIAEEGEPGAEKPSDPNAKGSDVLELTDVVNDDGSVVNVNSQQDNAPSSVLELTKVVEPAPAAVVKPAANDVLTNIDKALSSSRPDTGEGLLENVTIASAAAALKPLTGIPRDGLRSMESTPSPSFRSGTTVEDLVLEALRPMLKQWLDANLPSTVERIVEREVRKISSRFES